MADRKIEIIPIPIPIPDDLPVGQPAPGTSAKALELLRLMEEQIQDRGVDAGKFPQFCEKPPATGN